MLHELSCRYSYLQCLHPEVGTDVSVYPAGLHGLQDCFLICFDVHTQPLRDPDQNTAAGALAAQGRHAWLYEPLLPDSSGYVRLFQAQGSTY